MATGVWNRNKRPPGEADSVGGTSTLFYPGRRSTLSHTFAARFPIPEFAGVSSFRSCWRESKASYADFKDYFARLSKYATSGSQIFVGLDSARSIASSSSRKLAIMLQETSALQRTKSRRVPLFATASPRIHQGVEGKSVSVPLNPSRPRRRAAFARRGSLRAWSGELGFLATMIEQDHASLAKPAQDRT